MEELIVVFIVLNACMLGVLVGFLFYKIMSTLF